MTGPCLRAVVHDRPGPVMIVAARILICLPVNSKAYLSDSENGLALKDEGERMNHETTVLIAGPPGDVIKHRKPKRAGCFPSPADWLGPACQWPTRGLSSHAQNP